MKLSKAQQTLLLEALGALPMTKAEQLAERGLADLLRDIRKAEIDDEARPWWKRVLPR